MIAPATARLAESALSQRLYESALRRGRKSQEDTRLDEVPPRLQRTHKWARRVLMQKNSESGAAAALHQGQQWNSATIPEHC